MQNRLPGWKPECSARVLRSAGPPSGPDPGATVASGRAARDARCSVPKEGTASAATCAALANDASMVRLNWNALFKLSFVADALPCSSISMELARARDMLTHVQDRGSKAMETVVRAIKCGRALEEQLARAAQGPALAVPSASSTAPLSAISQELYQRGTAQSIGGVLGSEVLLLI